MPRSATDGKCRGSGSASPPSRCRPIGTPACISALPPSGALDVDAFHAAALKAGGTDNGRPGLRKDYGDSYYAAFIIDPEGYRLEAFCDRSD